jgi:hypothetical protein
MLAALAAGIGILAGPASGHWVEPEQILRRLESEEARKAFGIEEVRRDPALPRLLLIRVGEGWAKVAPAERIRAAEEWNHLWASSVRSGIVAIVDSRTYKALVNCDANGKAVLK